MNGQAVAAARPPVDRRAVAAAAVTVVLWASAFVAIRSAGREFSPGALALGRLLAGSAALLLLCLARREGPPPRGAWPGILVSGVLWFGVYNIALNWGEQQMDAGTAAMVVNVGPILIALLGGWLLKEGLPRRLLAGMAVSFTGAVVVGASLSNGDAPTGGSSVLGVLLCLLAAVTYAAGGVSQKPALRHGSPLQITTYGCVVGTVACLPFSGQLIGELSDASLSATLNMVYLGVFPTALGFTTWAYALARTSAGKMGATTYAAPALVVLMSWMLLGEVPGLLSLAGGVLCLTGVAVSRGSFGAVRAKLARSAPVTVVPEEPAAEPAPSR